MRQRAEVKIVRDVNPEAISAFENADAEDGIMLNHAYVDMRGYQPDEARDIVAEEAALLAEFEAVIDDDDRFTELLDEQYENLSEVGAFDIGVAGAITALSAAGAAPISSCNGGLFGDTSHASDVPHILFSIELDRLEPVLAAATVADVGLLNNSGHLEVFADEIPKLNLFATALLDEIARRSIKAG